MALPPGLLLPFKAHFPSGACLLDQGSEQLAWGEKAECLSIPGTEQTGLAEGPLHQHLLCTYCVPDTKLYVRVSLVLLQKELRERRNRGPFV